MVGRRWFLKALAAAAGIAASDPEALLWVPGRKTIFLPPPPAGLAFHRDAFSMAAIELPMPGMALRYLKDMLVFTKYEDRRYDVVLCGEGKGKVAR